MTRIDAGAADRSVGISGSVVNPAGMKTAVDADRGIPTLGRIGGRGLLIAARDGCEQGEQEDPNHRAPRDGHAS